MTKMFLTDMETVIRRLENTVETYKNKYCFGRSRYADRPRNKIFIPSQGIILEYCMFATEKKTRLIISASSPWSVISKDYEDIWVRQFLYDMDCLAESHRKTSLLFEKMSMVVNYLMFPQLKL